MESPRPAPVTYPSEDINPDRRSVLIRASAKDHPGGLPIGSVRAYPYKDWKELLSLPTTRKRKRYTRLYARITQEFDAFTVRITLDNPRDDNDRAGGEERTSSFEAASALISGVAKRFKISESNVSLAVYMENYKDGTWH